MSRSRGIYLVFRRELLERIRALTFRLSTIGILVLVAAGIVLIEKAPSIFGTGSETLGLVGQTSTQQLKDALQQTADQQGITLKLVDFTTESTAAAALKAGDLDAYLIGNQLAYKSKDNTSLTLAVNRALFSVQLPDTLTRLGISQQDASQLLNPQLAQVQLQEPARADEEARRIVSSVATIGLYLVLVLYGNLILMGVVEEKTSRVVEVLLGLLRPSDLLAGKTLGILASAVIQLAFGVAGGVVALAYVGISFLPHGATGVAIASIAYVVPGIVLYSLLYAAVGATVSRQSEAASAAMPISLFILVPYMLGLTVVPNAPDGALAQVLSIFPLTSALIMPTRIALGSPSGYEIALSYLLLWPTIFGVAWLGGKIYASAILMNQSLKPAQWLSLLRHRESAGSVRAG